MSFMHDLKSGAQSIWSSIQHAPAHVTAEAHALPTSHGQQAGPAVAPSPDLFAHYADVGTGPAPAPSPSPAVGRPPAVSPQQLEMELERTVSAKKLRQKGLRVVRSPDAAHPNQVTQAQFDELVDTYSEIKLGRGDLSIDTAGAEDPDIAQDVVMDDLATMLMTSTGRKIVGELNHFDASAGADSGDAHHRTVIKRGKLAGITERKADGQATSAHGFGAPAGTSEVNYMSGQSDIQLEDYLNSVRTRHAPMPANQRAAAQQLFAENDHYVEERAANGNGKPPAAPFTREELEQIVE